MDNQLASTIISAAFEVHRLLGGPGLLEGVYESALFYELSLRGLRSQRQVPIPVFYKGVAVRDPLFLDLFVEEKMIVELKATEKDYPVYHVQLLTYLRLMGIKSGLLINFGKQHLKDGVYRVVNEHSKTPALSLAHDS